jgi:pheromone shutdown protein TraB
MLAESFPALVAPLVTERDIFLSLTMKSSMAVNGCNRVVGVVGKGHAADMRY